MLHLHNENYFLFWFCCGGFLFWISLLVTIFVVHSRVSSHNLRFQHSYLFKTACYSRYKTNMNVLRFFLIFLQVVTTLIIPDNYSTNLSLSFVLLYSISGKTRFTSPQDFYFSVRTQISLKFFHNQPPRSVTRNFLPSLYLEHLISSSLLVGKYPSPKFLYHGPNSTRLLYLSSEVPGVGYTPWISVVSYVKYKIVVKPSFLR